MGTLLFSKRLLDYLASHSEINMQRQQEITFATIGIFGDFIYDLSVPSSWCLRDIERIDHQAFTFHWRSNTEQAVCPKCRTVSHHRTKTYKTKRIQDLPLSGMTVYHAIKSNRYFCDNPECDAITFVEQFETFADKNARLSNRLKDYVIREGLESSCNGAAKNLRKIGIRVNNDTINNEIKKKGAKVITDNLKRDDVHVLAVDDINLRKGNSSTACSVFLDAETHRVLVIVQGATSEIAEKVMQQYPSATMVSRDRGTAYAAAAAKCGKDQVADGFHLVQNLHQAIKEALYQEVPHDLFVRVGEGWIRIVDSTFEQPTEDAAAEEQSLVVIQPATLAPEDIKTRIHLAGLNTRQANKYRKTIEVLELTEKGLRTSEITKKLSIKKVDVINYRKSAPETIRNVELKIDEYYQMHEQGKWEYHQKTIAKKAKPSSESIVHPYQETVLRMWAEGKNHRHIHPVIVQEGFKGSANAIYQYLIKYAHENHIPYGRNARVIPLEERNEHLVVPRPPRISIERTSRHTIYESLLHAAANRRDEIKQAIQGLEAAASDSPDEDHPGTSAELENWINHTNYADSIAELIVDTKPKNKNTKKN